jgi:Protein of unknown function (DUF2844)
MAKQLAGAIRSRLQNIGLACVGGILAVLATGSPAHAALGGDTVSILADQGALQGTRHATVVDSYTVHEIQGANGTVVHEYQSSAGNVFAVAWHGPFMPDMSQILGSYYAQYAEARRAQKGIHKGRHPVVIDESGLVVQIGGHPQWFTGKAYIPDKLPPSLRAGDIR